MIKKIQILLGLTILLIASPCEINAQHSSKGMLSIAFCHYIDSLALELDSAVYKNSFGQTYTVSNFKYYIGNIHLKNTSGKEYASYDYFLINEDEEKSKKIILNTIPEGEYTSVSFIIGVDSSHNCSGAQSGALDPVNAMFWAWNSGYIFLKFEGRSSFSRSPGNIFEYHIGGYKSLSNCIRTVSLKFEQPISVANNKSAEIKIKVNAAEILNAPTGIDLTKLSSVTDSKNASIIADNYEDMFSIQK